MRCRRQSPPFTSPDTPIYAHKRLSLQSMPQLREKRVSDDVYDFMNLRLHETLITRHSRPTDDEVNKQDHSMFTLTLVVLLTYLLRVYTRVSFP